MYQQERQHDPASQWRSRAAYTSPRNQDRLLLSEPDAHQIGTPTHQCGVSLAWLQRFVKHCSGLAPYDNTEQLVSKVVVPLCKIGKQRCRLWDLVPAQHRGMPDWYIVHTWNDSLANVVSNLIHHLVNASESKRVKAAKLKRAATASRRASSVGELHSARTNHSHSEPLPSARSVHDPAEAARERQEQLLDSTYVWLDICALNQHAIAMSTAAGPSLDVVRTCISTARQGSLVCVDEQLQLLARAWCMYECWACVYYGDCQRLHVVFPDNLTLEGLTQFHAGCQQMDLTRSFSTRPADKQRILSEVKHKVGLRRMQQLLPDALMRSARAGLRWAGNLRNTSMYCAMLLKSREWHQVAVVLNSIPEIHDDEKTLQDIRDVFKLYDQDGSGELDKDEFIEVLGVAGFTTEEAFNIFDQVDVDGGGSVSLTEFESWWIESQRQQNREHMHCDTTLDKLVDNMKAMIVLLERQGLQEHVPFYTSSLSMLQGVLTRATRQGGPPPTLMPSDVKGDWHSVAEQCAWKVSDRKFQAAARLMYSLLSWNADTLPQDPDTISPPEIVQGLMATLQLLVQLMEQFGRLLARVPTNFRQSEYFMRAAREVSENYLEPLLEIQAEKQGLPRAKSRRRQNSLGMPMLGMGNHRRHDSDDDIPRPGPDSKGTKKKEAKSKSKNKGKGKLPNKRLFPGRFDMQREQIVSDMVKLKYGAGTLISAQHIVEAEKSLSSWMAAQKTAALSGARQDEREAVADFTTQYLSLASLPVPGAKRGDDDGLVSLPAIRGRVTNKAEGDSTVRVGHSASEPISKSGAYNRASSLAGHLLPDIHMRTSYT